MTTYTDANRNRRGGEIPQRSLTIGISCKETRQWRTSKVSQIVFGGRSIRTGRSRSTCRISDRVGSGPGRVRHGRTEPRVMGRSGPVSRGQRMPIASRGRSTSVPFPMTSRTSSITATIRDACARLICGSERIRTIWMTAKRRGGVSRRVEAPTGDTRGLNAPLVVNGAEQRSSPTTSCETSVADGRRASRSSRLVFATISTGRMCGRSAHGKRGSTSSERGVL